MPRLRFIALRHAGRLPDHGPVVPIAHAADAALRHSRVIINVRQGAR